MKKLLLILLTTISCANVYSQDLIVTNEGDSINCKITKLKNDFIYFTFIHKDEIRNTLLPVSQIKHHEWDFYETNGAAGISYTPERNYPTIRVALNGGFSYQIAKIHEGVPADFKDYIRELKSGYHFGGDITYYFAETLGAGFKYYLFKSSNSLDNIYIDDMNGNRRYGKMSDNITVSFIGPSFSTRILNYDKTNSFLMNIGLGYMGYSNDMVLIDKYKMSGSTAGYIIDIGYDIGLSERFALGFQLSLVSGTLFKYEWDDGITTETIELEEGEYESLNRLDLSVGLRFLK